MFHNKKNIPIGFENLTESFQKSYSVNIDDIIIDQKTNIWKPKVSLKSNKNISKNAKLFSAKFES